MTPTYLKTLTHTQLRTVIDDLCRRFHEEGTAPLWVNAPQDSVFRHSQIYGVYDELDDGRLDVATICRANRFEVQPENFSEWFRLKPEEVRYVRQRLEGICPGLEIRQGEFNLSVVPTPEYPKDVLCCVIYQILTGTLTHE